MSKRKGILKKLSQNCQFKLFLYVRVQIFKQVKFTPQSDQLIINYIKDSMPQKQKGSIYYEEDSQHSQQKEKDSSQIDNSLVQDTTRRDKIQLIFPPYEFKQQLYTGKQQVWAVLKHFNQERAKFYKITINQGYMYIKCKQCESRITMKQKNEQSVWKIQKFCNSHCHKIKQNKKDQQTQVIQYMEQHGLTFQTPGIDVLLQQKFDLNKRRFFYIRNKKFDTRQSLEAFMKKLLKNGGKLYQSQWARNQPAPEFIIYANKQMQQNYMKFGDCMRFDISYGLCRLRSSQGKKWNVGMFNGFSQNLSPIIFGVLIIKDQTVQNFKKAFRKFFFMMGGTKFPQIVITGQQQSASLAIEQLSNQNGKNFIHLLDQFHIIKFFRKKFKQRTQRQDVEYLRQMMYSRDRSVVEDAKRSLNNKYQRQTWWTEYMRKISKWSVFYAEKKFYGLSITTSANEKLNDLLKAKLQYETTIQQIIRKVQALANQQSNRPIKIRKNPILKCFDDSRLVKLQYKLGSKIFFRFLSYYVQAIQMEVESKTVNQQNRSVYKINLADETEYPHPVTQNSCQCGILGQQGIPCSHILCIYQADRALDLQAVIKPRWLLPGEREKYQYNGRPRLSRRNRSK